MASAAEQLAANLSWKTFGKAKDLQRRILYTLLVLVVYRFGTYVPLPGINPQALQQLMQSTQHGILGMFNAFSGGAVERMSILALGIMPYISASIIVQLMTSMVPSLEKLKKEGESGRRKINQYTRYGTVALAILQGWGIVAGLANQGTLIDGGAFYRVATVAILVGGTMMLLWLGEQITARGVGNGVSLIIFAGIVAEMPRAIGNLLQQGSQNIISPALIISLIVFGLLVIAFVVFMERAQRRILVQYPKRQVGPQQMTGGESSHLPLKVNTAGVIPAIFASSLLLLPMTVASFAGENAGGWLSTLTAALGPGQPLYLLIYAALIIFFAFFYTAVVFNPADVADNLKKQGGFIPGVRPGERTAQYLDYVLTRLTAIGAVYMAAVCLLPELMRARWTIPFYFGGTSLLIVVSVTMDTITQVQSHLIAHQYEGLIQKSRLRGKRR
ncbi:preprotein translocase subunit SecY [Neomegalonema sp.]|uniref:preprotein translocase subunit SecY n=1 Tax=Neomegalonema sp. TaxID=2039713 RepID=UPI0026294387|nr:preprotein translocase subunit SecY [Neomegalonema sp.]MDD2866979.1 preprotein translocase subunit SecY [Neomegalonema sp.]